MIQATKLIMNNNMFQFGNVFFKQQSGTAMGAPPAPGFATLSYGTHKESFLQNKSPCLLYYKRYIDDMFLIWRKHPDPIVDAREWSQLQDQAQSWELDWVFEDRKKTVVFLDLRITIQATNTIHTDLYTKALNLYLYLPPRSAHPPGVLYGLVAGSVYRAYILCSDENDAIQHLRLFWNRLLPVSGN